MKEKDFKDKKLIKELKKIKKQDKETRLNQNLHTKPMVRKLKRVDLVPMEVKENERDTSLPSNKVVNAKDMNTFKINIENIAKDVNKIESDFYSMINTLELLTSLIKKIIELSQFKEQNWNIGKRIEKPLPVDFYVPKDYYDVEIENDGNHYNFAKPYKANFWDKLQDEYKKGDYISANLWYCYEGYLNVKTSTSITDEQERTMKNIPLSALDNRIKEPENYYAMKYKRPWILNRNFYKYMAQEIIKNWYNEIDRLNFWNLWNEYFERHKDRLVFLVGGKNVSFCLSNLNLGDILALDFYYDGQSFVRLYKNIGKKDAEDFFKTNLKDFLKKTINIINSMDVELFGDFRILKGVDYILDFKNNLINDLATKEFIKKVKYDIIKEIEHNQAQDIPRLSPFCGC